MAQNLYLNGLIRSSTSELIAFRKEFEDNYDNITYLRDLGNKVAGYSKTNQIADGYFLLDEIDERILELDNGS